MKKLFVFLMCLLSFSVYGKEIEGHGGPKTKTGILYRDIVSQGAKAGDTAILRDGTKVTYTEADIKKLTTEYEKIRQELQANSGEIRKLLEESLTNLKVTRPKKGGKPYPIDDAYLNTLYNQGVIDFIADGYDYTQIIVVSCYDADRMIRFKREFTQPPFNYELAAEGNPTTALFIKGIDAESLLTYSFNESYTAIKTFLKQVTVLTAPVNELTVISESEFERLRIKYNKVESATDYKISIYDSSVKEDGKSKLVASYTTAALTYISYDQNPGDYEVEVIPYAGKNPIKEQTMYKAVKLKERKENIAQGVGFSLEFGTNMGFNLYYLNRGVVGMNMSYDFNSYSLYGGYSFFPLRNSAIAPLIGIGSYKQESDDKISFLIGTNLRWAFYNTPTASFYLSGNFTYLIGTTPNIAVGVGYSFKNEKQKLNYESFKLVKSKSIATEPYVVESGFTSKSAAAKFGADLNNGNWNYWKAVEFAGLIEKPIYIISRKVSEPLEYTVTETSTVKSYEGDVADFNKKFKNNPLAVGEYGYQQIPMAVYKQVKVAKTRKVTKYEGGQSYVSEETYYVYENVIDHYEYYVRFTWYEKRWKIESSYEMSFVKGAKYFKQIDPQ